MKKNLIGKAAVSLVALLCAAAAFGLTSCEAASDLFDDTSGSPDSSTENGGSVNTNKRLPPPDLISMSTDGTSIFLEWKAVEGADEYCVYFAQGETVPSEGSDSLCRTSTGCQLVLDNLPGPGPYSGYIVAVKKTLAGYPGTSWSITIREITYPPFVEECSYSDGYVNGGYELGLGYDEDSDSIGPNLFTSFHADTYRLYNTGAWMDYSLFSGNNVPYSLFLKMTSVPVTEQGWAIKKSFFPNAAASAFLKDLAFGSRTITAYSYMRIQYEYRVPMLLYGTFVENITELPYPSYVRETINGLEVFFLYQLHTESRYDLAETKASLDRLIQNSYRISETYTEEDRSKDLSVVLADGNSVKSFAYSNLSLPGVGNIKSFGDYQDYMDGYFALDAAAKMDSLGLVEAFFFPLSYNPGPH